jgi:hypothetical protein
MIPNDQFSVHDDFYIGYAPPMPPTLAHFVRRVAVVVSVSVAASGALLAVGHVPLDGGSFEFTQARVVSGTIVARPYARLRPDVAQPSESTWPLLVAPGKHGADGLLGGLDGRHVQFEAKRIQRGSWSMLEIHGDGPMRSDEVVLLTAQSTIAGGPSSPRLTTLIGEIVDTKCFLGVMVPGSGKTHKECASLCLRGHIPAGLFVKDRAGRSALMLLTGPSGALVNQQALALVGEPVEVTGTVHSEGGWLVLQTDPATWRSLTP